MSARLERAVAALSGIRAGVEPDLTDAPTIQDWMPALVEGETAVSLVGAVYGHPQIEDGKIAVTSVVLAIALDESWARTVNRYYRLGRRGDDAIQ